MHVEVQVRRDAASVTRIPDVLALGHRRADANARCPKGIETQVQVPAAVTTPMIDLEEIAPVISFVGVILTRDDSAR